MTLEEMITLFRAQSKDEKHSVGGGDGDVLCSDELLTLYANEAQDEACRRGDLLRDSSSPLTAIAFTAGAESVPLDSKVLRILRARVDGHCADGISVEDMDASHPGWQDTSVRSRPTMLITGMSTGALFLWPRPEQDGTLRFTVQRLPLKPLRNENDKPEIRPELHRGLVEWMLYRAYSREDTDLYNDAKAALALRRFEAEFGGKTSGRNEAWARNGAEAGSSPIA